MKDFFEKIIFPPMRALKFITGHVIYKPAYTYKFQLKTTKIIGFCEHLEVNQNGSKATKVIDAKV